MVYKDFSPGIIMRGLVIAVASVGGTLSYLESYWIGLGLSVAIILFVILNTVYYYNTINRKLTFFFEAIKNEDSSLHFPDHVKQEPVKNLHKSLNDVNEVLSAIKTKSEHKEWFFKELMKHSSTGLIAINSMGYVEIVNKTALRLFGARLLVHVERLKQLSPAFYEAIQSMEQNTSKTIKVLVNDEFHVILIRFVKLKFQNDEFSLYSLNDIKSELEENELDTWQKLIRILTHEIMNSISPISSISDTLSGYFKNDQEITKEQLNNVSNGLNVINERSKGLTHFVDNYRRLSKIPKPEFGEIFIDEWLDHIRKLADERAIKEKISFDILNSVKTRKTFLGDQKLLTQVALNLFNNSADSLTQQKGDKKFRILVSEKEENISFQFIDNGPGINPETLEHIFIPFFTTKDEGSGIGLSLSRQIMRLHKGKLNVRSTPGMETVFEMRI